MTREIEAKLGTGLNPTLTILANFAADMLNGAHPDIIPYADCFSEGLREGLHSCQIGRMMLHEAIKVAIM